MTTEPIAPATDEEIADTALRAVRVTGIGSTRALRLIARIEAQAKTIAELRAELSSQGEIVAQLHKELVNANAAIARMKAGHDEIIEARTVLRLIPLRAEVQRLKERLLKVHNALDASDVEYAYSILSEADRT